MVFSVFCAAAAGFGLGGILLCGAVLSGTAGFIILHAVRGTACKIRPYTFFLLLVFIGTAAEIISGAFSGWKFCAAPWIAFIPAFFCLFFMKRKRRAECIFLAVSAMLMEICFFSDAGYTASLLLTALWCGIFSAAAEGLVHKI